MSKSNRVYPLILSSIDATTIDNLHLEPFRVDGDPYPLPEACFFIRITNACNNAVLVSFNNLGLHLYIPSGEHREINFQTNASPSNYVSLLKKGTLLSAGGATDEGGYIYLAGYYNERT